MTDIVEPDGDLWDWVVQNGGQTKEAIWPSDSETAAWDLATAWTASATALRAAVQLSGSAAAELRKVWTDAAGFELFYAIHSLNKGSLGEPGVEEMAVMMDSLSAACRDYGNLIVSAKHAIRKHISDNNELFDRCTSWASRTVFAIQVAHQLSTLLTEYAGKVGKPAGEETKPPKKPREGFLGGLVDGLEEVGSFFVGMWEGAVEMFVGFAALAGYGDGHFSWSTFGDAWKGLGKFGLAVATYSTPGLAQLDQTVGLPGFDRGEMGSTLVEAGKTMVAWDTWSEDPSRAAGKTTFNIASAVLGTKGAGAAIRGAGTAAAGSKVSAVAAAGRVAEKAGTAITKIPTGTELAAKAVRKIPGVDSLLAKVGLGQSPAGVPAHAGDTPPPPHTPRTPDETPPANPPGDRRQDGPPPEGPPNRPAGDRTPDHVPDEQRPSRAPDERAPVRQPEPSVRPEPSTRPDPPNPPDPPTRPDSPARPEPVARPEPPARPGSVGEAMDPGSHRTPGTEQGSPAPKANEAPNPAASEAPSHHSQAGSPEATGHRARDADEPTATIDRETGEVRMSDRVDPADTREHLGLPEKETVRKAQEDWAGSTPVNPQTPRQKGLYTVARVLGLVHTVEDAATGHTALPTSKVTDTPPPKESTPKDPAAKDKDKAPEETAPPKSLPDGDPGLPPRRDPTLVDVDLDAGKPRPAGHPDPPPPKGEPELAGQTPSAGPAARAEGAVPETPRPPTRSPQGSGGLWPEPGPRLPGSRMPMGDPFQDLHSGRRRPPIRGGDHPRHPQPARTPDGDVPPPRTPEEHVPPVRDIDSAINPEPARAHPDAEGPHEGGRRDDHGDHEDQHTPHEDAHVPDDTGSVPYDDVPKPRTIDPDSPEFSERFAEWNRPDDSTFDGPRERPDGRGPIDSPKVIDEVNPRRQTREPDPDGVPKALRREKPLAMNAEYKVAYKNGATSRFFTDDTGKVTHVETTLPTSKPFHNPDLRYPLQPNTQYRVPNFHDPSKHWTFEVGDNGKPSAMTGDPVFKGKHDDFRDDTSQGRSGREGKAAYQDHPVYKDKYAHVEWAGGHFSAHEMGGPGEYVNMHPQMAASNSGHYKDGWIHDASWRAQEAELGKFADVPGQSVENYQVRMEGDSNGIPENVVMRWQEVVHKVDDQGNPVLGADGKPVELSRVTKQRDFPNDPSNVNYGPRTRYGEGE